jgi:RNA polymerase sigma factor (sigma-70 family)
MKQDFVEPSTQMQQWIDRLKAGESGAREALIVHAQERLRLLVRRVLRGYPNAKQWEQTSGVLQGVNLRLLNSLTPQKQLPPTALDFLRLSAYHIRKEILDLLRKSRRAPELLPQLPDLPGPKRDGLLPTLRWQEIHEHLAQLPEDERLFFDLLYYEGLTQAEAARVMGMKLTEVRKRWAVLRRQFGEWLGEDDIG